MDAIRGIKAWQMGVLVAVSLLGAGGAYAAYSLVTGSDQPDLEEDQQLVPVTRGDLVNQVSVNGSLAYPNRESLRFAVPGTVGEVLVEEGQPVVAGQPLARIDAETVASLDKAVAQAEVALRDAKEALEAANQPYSDLDVAEAEADVVNARIALEAARDALARLLEPTPKDLAEAEEDAVNARIALEAAVDALARLLVVQHH